MSKPDSTHFSAPLTDLAVISIAGADASSFLHGQLTHDITGLDARHARLNGYCTAQGRLLATLLVWRDAADPEQFFALVRSDIAQAIVKRLSMFVFRSNVQISVSPIKVTGVCVGNDADMLADINNLTGLNIPTLPPTSVWQVHHTEAATFIAAPGATTTLNRWWLIETGPTPATGEPSLTSMWQVQDIAAGLPWIGSATQELFIPQTLNLDLIDAVSFTKGCYPGQEVVARSHYRGTIKRRMAYGSSPGRSELDIGQLPGVDIFNAIKPNAPCGRVINAARHNDQTYFLLEIQLADRETADFRVGQANGPAISLHALPYSLLADS